jgi:hypothetical protein
MLDLFNTPTPQQSNCQEFYGGRTTRDWIKPRGASMVRFMLIGAGGGGGNGAGSNGGGGGGSGAITSWIGPAMFVPDTLRITVGAGGTSGVNATASTVIYQAKDGTGYTLLTANGGASGTTAITAGSAGTAMTNNAFGASGIFTSTAGQLGQDGGSTGGGNNQPASGSTFLSGGAGGSGATASTGGSVTPNYNYPALPATTAGGTVKGADGYFVTQPILVGCGGAGGSTNTTAGTGGGIGGIGCGGGGSGEDASSGGRGGDGAVFIWAW